MLVMKFGGTSVQDSKAIRRVAEIVKGRLPKQPVVVVSAMAKVTDQLITMARAASSGDLDSALSLSQAMRERHYTVAAELMPKDEFAAFRNSLSESFDSLDALLRGITAVGELSPRTTDYVLSFGELLSSAVVTAGFGTLGMPSTLVDTREVIVTDGQHTKAVPLFEETDPRLAERLQPLLDKGRVPVMGGFIGATAAGITTTIGRGGSDFTAAIIGAALNAEAIEIWTDVDGIKTTDPNLCPEAERLEEVSFDEAAEMAFFGAKVLHPATMLPAMKKDIPVLVLNSHNPSSSGTCVRTHAKRSVQKQITAICAKKNLTIVNVNAGRMLVAHAFLHDVFQVMKQHQILVDTVSTSEVSVSMTVDSKIDLTKVVEELRAFADVEIETGKAIVCVVGDNLRGTKGMLSRIFSTIKEVNVRMVSQGASEINIAFVIEEKDVPEAVKRLHKQFIEDAAAATA